MADMVPFEVAPHELRLRIEAKLKNPNVGRIVSATIKNGPQSFRFATMYEIIDPATGAHHHWCLKINSVGRTKKAGWKFKAERSVLLGDEGSSELTDLVSLIQTSTQQGRDQESGEYELVPADQVQSIKSLIRFARRADGPQRMRVIKALLENLDVTSIAPADWVSVFETGAGGLRQTISISARLVEYGRIRDSLASLIANPGAGEQQLQTLLSQNPWLFGSEYSQLLARRTWTRDDRLDFMLRRAADDYLEIIEIKTPFQEALLRYDSSHDSFAPSGSLSLAIGQVMRYIEEVERNRDSIVASDGCDPLKIRARVIIGRDGDAKQMAALRNLNGHLHRVEVLTFDQLLRIADRVLSVFSGSLETQTATQTQR